MSFVQYKPGYPRPVTLLSRDFDVGAYDDLLRRAHRGESLMAGDLVAPASLDSWESFFREHPSLCDPYSPLSRAYQKPLNRAGKLQAEWEADRAERQRQREEAAAAQWEASAPKWSAISEVDQRWAELVARVRALTEATGR